MDYNVFNLAHLKDLSDGDLALQVDTMADLFDGHPAYKDQTLPPWIVGPAQLRAHSVDLRHLSPAAKHDESKEAERQQVREKVVQAITFSSQYVVMFAAHENDSSHLENIGLEPRHRNYNKEAPKKPGMTKKFVVKHNQGVSGSVIASVNAWEGKGSVELQVCEGDPANEASWRTINIFHSCRMMVDGLEPATRCHFRARLRNDAGNGPWSEVVELIIL